MYDTIEKVTIYFLAVEFMWNCTVESLKMLQDEKVEGAGCILAHCMGLGKTLSVRIYIVWDLVKLSLYVYTLYVTW